MKHALVFLSLALLGIELCYGTPARKDFVTRRGEPVYIECDTAKVEPVVKTALEMLAHDCAAVLDAELHISPNLDSIAKQGSFIVMTSQALEGWEHFCLQSRAGKLFLGASDAHGMAYGLLEISRLLGVSPWEWWADVTPRKRDELRIAEGTTIDQKPDVPFRGIFINDEDWGLMPWSSQNYEPTEVAGQIGPKTYAKVFELLLRLRANTIWPAMHEVTVPFFLVPGNREMAARYGIYIGGSHCEPMATSPAGEWPRRGVGDYDYVNNSAEVYRFWEDRMKEVTGQEILYTIGMRGVHDSGMLGAKGVEEQKTVLTRAIADQRQLLKHYVNEDVTQVPQVFIPYKEVLDIYHAGLEVPEDVCLMWCDDNYGYIRHFPTEAEAARQGGNGIYYHVSYWGRPHDYLWLGTFSPALLYQQMRLAYDKGIKKIWILNVGDIKPAEYQIELFMDMAWDIDKVNKMGVKEHARQFYAREFGKELSNDLQTMMEESFRLAFVRKPEFLGGTRTEEADKRYWGTVRDLPWSKNYVEQRLKDYQRLSDNAEAIEKRIPEDRKDAYFQLVKYPVQAADQMNRKLLFAQYARHGLMEWERSDAAFDSIVHLTQIYNEGIHNNGKWNRIMDYKPRKLSVFEPVEHTQVDEPWPDEANSIAQWEGTDAKGRYASCEGLGYAGKAILLLPNEEVTYTFTAPKDADSLIVELHMLPTHPVDDEHLAVEVSLDAKEYCSVDYRTVGRSEEWKQNVLRNQAVKCVKLPCKHGKKQVLRLKTPYEGIVLDQIYVR